ncbi:MAG: hypothetical protein J1F39_04400 [Clostridiales bacterium]|nr:hypothetical protein [Clostridiales bacterium]
MDEKLKLHEMLYPLGLLDTLNKMREDIAGKTDAVEGKGFSSNDFTDECLAALNGALRFDEAQELSEQQRKTAVRNIGGDKVLSANDFTDGCLTALNGAVRFDIEQQLNEFQKKTAVKNIGALSAESYPKETADKVFSFAQQFKSEISVWISVSDKSPAELFGGMWERISGKFLLGADDEVYAANSTGGSADAVNISHKHTITYLYSGSGGIDPEGAVIQKGKAGPWPGFGDASQSSGASTLSSSGVSGEGKNMPPYIALYIWKRIA